MEIGAIWFVPQPVLSWVMARRVFFQDARDPAGADQTPRRVLIFNAAEHPASPFYLAVPLPDGDRTFTPGVPILPFDIPAGVDRVMFVLNVTPIPPISDNRRTAPFVATGTNLKPFYVLRCNGPTFTVVEHDTDPSAAPSDPLAPPAPMPKGCATALFALFGLWRS